MISSLRASSLSRSQASNARRTEYWICRSEQRNSRHATQTALVPSRLVRKALADHPEEENISLLAISVSHLEKHWKIQLEFPLGLEDEKRRPGTKRGMARWTADRAVDMIRDRFGWDAVGYGSVMLGLSRSVPDEFRELAEKNL